MKNSTGLNIRSVKKVSVFFDSVSTLNLNMVDSFEFFSLVFFMNPWFPTLKSKHTLMCDSVIVCILT